jgi:hypothetical protein
MDSAVGDAVEGDVLGVAAEVQGRYPGLSPDWPVEREVSWILAVTMENAR